MEKVTLGDVTIANPLEEDPRLAFAGDGLDGEHGVKHRASLVTA